MSRTAPLIPGATHLRLYRTRRRFDTVTKVFDLNTPTRFNLPIVAKHFLVPNFSIRRVVAELDGRGPVSLAIDMD